MRNSAAYEEAYHYKPMKPMNFKSPSASHKSYKPNREALLAAAKRNLGHQDLDNRRSATNILRKYATEHRGRKSSTYDVKARREAIKRRGRTQQGSSRLFGKKSAGTQDRSNRNSHAGT
ncbi:hypothetical protein Droror1_Dr00022734 [Drosera rotundifolia]